MPSLFAMLEKGKEQNIRRQKTKKMAAACQLTDSLRLKSLLRTVRKSIEEKKKENKGMDERMRMRRIPRGEPDNENSYLWFSLCQAGIVGELGEDGSFITEDTSMAWRREAWQG